MSHVCALSGHVCTRVYTCAHVCGLTVLMCELYMPCPRMVIHICVYYYKLIPYADGWVCTQLIIQTQKITFLHFCHRNLIAIYTNTP